MPMIQPVKSDLQVIVMDVKEDIDSDGCKGIYYI